MTREVREALERLRPSLGEQTDLLWGMVLSGDRRSKEELERDLLVLDLARNNTTPGSGPPPLPPPQTGVLDGWLRLGSVSYPNTPPSPFGLERGELIQHVGIFGRSGAGKTNTVLCILRGLLERKVPFMIFDWKRNFRDILAAPWVPEGEVVALTAGRDIAPLHLNPLRPPPDTDPKVWLKKLIEILAHAYFLGEGVMFLLQEALDEAYRRFGVYDGSGKYPTFRDVHTILRTRKVLGREANWMASTLRATGSLTFGSADETFCSSNPTDIKSLLHCNVILELDALSDADKVFLVESLFLYIHHLRLAEPERETTKHILFVEEAHHVFLRSKQELTGGEPITDVILREIRELGEAVILVDQHPSQIAVTALGNTYCTIAMNLKHRADVTTVGDACLLEPSQREHLGRLPVGCAVVKLQDRWTSPFMVRFPPIAIAKGSVSDDMLRLITAAGPILSESKPPIVPIREILVPSSVAGKVSLIPRVPKGASPAAETTGEEQRFLQDVAGHPGSSVTERYARLGFSRRAGTVLKMGILGRGLANEVPVALPAGRVNLLELTDTGWDAVGAPRPSPRHGGAIHRYWIEKTAEVLRKQGYQVEREVAAGEGRTIDLVGRAAIKSVAVEIEVSGRRLEESLRKLEVVDAKRRVVLCANREVEERATKLAAGFPRVEVVHVWRVLSGASWA